MPENALEIRYVPLSKAVRWDRNAKRHDLAGIISSIRRYGFRDAPIFDSVLGAIVAGNGRLEALQIMRSSGEALPRGLRLEGDEWLVPIQFGVDAATPGEAEAFGVDHNNLTAAGGGGGREALTDLWDAAGIHALLEDLGGNGAAPNTADAFDDYEAFAQAVGKPTSDDSKDPQVLAAGAPCPVARAPRARAARDRQDEPRRGAHRDL